jgi:Leucine-rich repeat (LRR) protein
MNVLELIESNRLRDAIPNELSKLPLLEELILFDNFFESLPTNIGSFSSLKKLDVERNRLFGTLFNADFANLADTLEFLLASNQQVNGGFTGTIPTYIRNFTKLKELALSRNRFSGSIPAQITELQSLGESNILIHVKILHSINFLTHRCHFNF